MWLCSIHNGIVQGIVQRVFKAAALGPSCIERTTVPYWVQAAANDSCLYSQYQFTTHAGRESRLQHAGTCHSERGAYTMSASRGSDRPPVFARRTRSAKATSTIECWEWSLGSAQPAHRRMDGTSNSAESHTASTYNNTASTCSAGVLNVIDTDHTDTQAATL
jgi:hypothetical protein